MDLIIMGAIVLGITQLFKKTFNLSPRYAPVTALAVSLILFSISASLGAVKFNWELIQNAIIAGLTSAGLWSGAKTTFTNPDSSI